MYVGAVLRWLLFGGHAGHVDADRVAAFLAGRRRATSAATVNMDIKALRAFYRLQAAWGDASAADIGKIPRQRKIPPRLPRYLTDEQVGLVLAGCPDTFVGRRDRAIVMTLYATGMRASELAAMHASHLLGDGLLYIVGKGGKARYVPVGDLLAGILADYQKDRRTTRPRKGGNLWVAADGRPLASGRSIWRIVSTRIWQAIGLQAGLHKIKRGGGRPWTGHFPHELRASCATALLHRGMPLPAVAELLGHDSIATTGLYTGADLAYLRDAASHHPRARLAVDASGNLASSDMKR